MSQLKSGREAKAMIAHKHVSAYSTKVPKLDASVMPVRVTTEMTPMTPMTAETAIMANTAMCGVTKVLCRRPSGSGISLSCAMAKVMRTPVFIADSVVPRMASATVMAMTTIKPKPTPPSSESPIRRIRSPIGALEAPAASRPVSAVPSAAVPVSLSEMAKLAAKYSIR